MKIVLVASLAYSLINFRGTLIATLAAAGHDVICCAPDHDPAIVDALHARGARFQTVPMGRTGLNPLEDAATLLALVRLLRRERPAILLAYTQKPIIYSGLANRLVGNARFFPMVTGLGYIFTGATRRPLLRRLVAHLYRAAMRGAARVIVFNRDDGEELRRHAIIDDRHVLVLVPGSGVDLDHFRARPVPAGNPVFLLVARLLRDKGLCEYATAAKIVRAHFPRARFRLLGPFDSNPAAITAAQVDEWRRQGVVDYLGATGDVRPHLAACTVFVLPSYREGLPRTVLEAMATGRAVITSDAPGCRDTVRHGANGYVVPVGDAAALAEAMLCFCRDPSLAEQMGAASRAMAEARYAVGAVNRLLIDTMGLDGQSPATRHVMPARAASLPSLSL